VKKMYLQRSGKTIVVNGFSDLKRFLSWRVNVLKRSKYYLRGNN
jgi:hypothetical protein